MILAFSCDPNNNNHIECYAFEWILNSCKANNNNLEIPAFCSFIFFIFQGPKNCERQNENQ